MKRSALFFASVLVLAGHAFAEPGKHNGRGPIDVDLGLGDVVDATADIGGDSLADADVNLGLDTPVAADASNAAANAVNYATRQVNSGN
ncbi:MAG TPA: hypothetical protein DCG65_02470, partial [Hyphomonas atlantica]|nr:hypothetical protein [Hyphomonas atlantica]